MDYEDKLSYLEDAIEYIENAIDVLMDKEFVDSKNGLIYIKEELDATKEEYEELQSEIWKKEQKELENEYWRNAV